MFKVRINGYGRLKGTFETREDARRAAARFGAQATIIEVTQDKPAIERSWRAHR